MTSPIRRRSGNEDAARRFVAEVIAEMTDVAFITGLLRDISEFGVEDVACVHGWCAGCNGTKYVKTCGHGGCACPCAESPCGECGGV